MQPMRKTYSKQAQQNTYQSPTFLRSRIAQDQSYSSDRSNTINKLRKHKQGNYIDASVLSNASSESLRVRSEAVINTSRDSSREGRQKNNNQDDSFMSSSSNLLLVRKSFDEVNKTPNETNILPPPKNIQDILNKNSKNIILDEHSIYYPKKNNQADSFLNKNKFLNYLSYGGLKGIRYIGQLVSNNFYKIQNRFKKDQQQSNKQINNNIKTDENFKKILFNCQQYEQQTSNNPSRIMPLNRIDSKISQLNTDSKLDQNTMVYKISQLSCPRALNNSRRLPQSTSQKKYTFDKQLPMIGNKNYTKSKDQQKIMSVNESEEQLNLDYSNNSQNQSDQIKSDFLDSQNQLQLSSEQLEVYKLQYLPSKKSKKLEKQELNYNRIKGINSPNKYLINYSQQVLNQNQQNWNQDKENKGRKRRKLNEKIDEQIENGYRGKVLRAHDSLQKLMKEQKSKSSPLKPETRQDIKRTTDFFSLPNNAKERAQTQGIINKVQETSNFLESFINQNFKATNEPKLFEPKLQSQKKVYESSKIIMKVKRQIYLQRQRKEKQRRKQQQKARMIQQQKQKPPKSVQNIPSENINTSNNFIGSSNFSTMNNFLQNTDKNTNILTANINNYETQNNNQKQKNIFGLMNTINQNRSQKSEEIGKEGSNNQKSFGANFPNIFSNSFNNKQINMTPNIQNQPQKLEKNNEKNSEDNQNEKNDGNIVQDKKQDQEYFKQKVPKQIEQPQKQNNVMPTVTVSPPVQSNQKQVEKKNEKEINKEGEKQVDSFEGKQKETKEEKKQTPQNLQQKASNSLAANPFISNSPSKGISLIDIIKMDDKKTDIFGNILNNPNGENKPKIFSTPTKNMQQRIQQGPNNTSGAANLARENLPLIKHKENQQQDLDSSMFDQSEEHQQSVAKNVGSSNYSFGSSHNQVFKSNTLSNPATFNNNSQFGLNPMNTLGNPKSVQSDFMKKSEPYVASSALRGNIGENGFVPSAVPNNNSGTGDNSRSFFFLGNNVANPEQCLRMFSASTSQIAEPLFGSQPVPLKKKHTHDRNKKKPEPRVF